MKVQDLPYRLLVMLLERPGEIVTREEVRQRLWPQNTFVEFDNSLGVAIRKVRDALNDDADTPRYVETLPRRGYRFVAPVTALGTVQSPGPSPLTALVTKESPASSRSGATEAAQPHPRRKYWLMAALVLLLVGGAIYAFRARPHRPADRAEAAGTGTPPRIRRSVAVLGFRNLPGHPEDNWLSPAFAEMLNTELAANGALRMVPGEDIARVKRELPLPDEDSLAKATLERLRINSGADVVVLGSYTRPFGQRRQTHPAGCTRAGYCPRRDHFRAILHWQRGKPVRTRHPGRSGASAEPGNRLGLRPSQPAGSRRSSLQSRGSTVLYGGPRAFMVVRLWTRPRSAGESRRRRPRLSARARRFGRCMESSGLRIEGSR